LEPPLRYLKQQESSNARHLIAQAIIDCAHKGIREPDEKRPCTYEDPDRLKSEGSMTPEANISALCHEFTNALTEVLAENAVGLARRGRIATSRFAHPYYASGIAFLRGRYHQVVRPRRYLAKFANRFCRHADASVGLNMHRIRQSTERHLERGNAFRFVSHWAPSSFFSDADNSCSMVMRLGKLR
jgi:hypothetical protein